MARTFADRHAAGRALAERLAGLAAEDPVVVGLARGGIPVAYEVAAALGAPLDLLVVRKIGAPANPEYGIGAVAEGGVTVLDDDAVRSLLVSHEDLEAATARARDELAAGVRRHRGAGEPLDVSGRTVIVVDDGLATGGTARAALRAVRRRRPRRLVLAVPVGALATVAALREQADEVVCLAQPRLLWAVGAWYEHFDPTTDEEVAELLAGRVADAPARAPVRRHGVRIPAGLAGWLDGELALPDRCLGLVVFAHGSGSSRHSPRNRAVAAALNRRGLATLLLDLLTPAEEPDRTMVFDVPLLAKRLLSATRWARGDPRTAGLPLACFGASTGAAAALWAAAEAPGTIRAVVSRGGRPDLAASRLGEVRVPVLLIVGGADELVLALNRQAATGLGDSRLAVVPGATYLFEEPGALAEASRLAGDWLVERLRPAAGRAA